MTKTSNTRPAELPGFDIAWRRYEEQGFRYGRDALENVEFGYRIARDELAALRSQPTPSEDTPTRNSTPEEQANAIAFARKMDRDERMEEMMDATPSGEPVSVKRKIVLAAETAGSATASGEPGEQAKAISRDELPEHAPLGELLWSVWEQADENHRHHSDMGDRESDIRFLSLGLCGEAGELANFIKKRWRDGDAHHDAIGKEIADVCAYAFMLANVMGLSPGCLLKIMAEKQRIFVEKMQARALIGDKSNG